MRSFWFEGRRGASSATDRQSVIPLEACSNERDKADVIAFLRRCSGGEVSDVMRHVLPDRQEAAPEPGAFQYRLFLGFALRKNTAERAGQVEWEPWRLSAIAYLDPAHHYPPDFPGEPLCQEGQCVGVRRRSPVAREERVMSRLWRGRVASGITRRCTGPQPRDVTVHRLVAGAAS